MYKQGMAKKEPDKNKVAQLQALIERNLRASFKFDYGSVGFKSNHDQYKSNFRLLIEMVGTNKSNKFIAGLLATITIEGVE